MSEENKAYFASKLKRILQTEKKKVSIQAYISYGSDKIVHVRGRVLKDEEIVTAESDSYYKSFKNSLKRIESDELPLQDLTISFKDLKQTIKTNSEGFFHWIAKLEKGQEFQEFEKIEFSIARKQIPAKYLQVKVVAEGEVLFPEKSAQFGVISDIDDTILKTEVLTAYKLKALYNTLFIKASKRMPISYANTWYQQLRNGKVQEKNPIFYISNSPWNIYDYLAMFLKMNKFPKGPILLRDFGLRAKDTLQEYRDHKKNEIVRLLETYPKLSFVLIGDGGERDADIYLAIKKKFKARILAIFVHRLGNKKHQARIEKLAQGHEDYFFFISDANEAIKISKRIGLVD